MDVIPYDICDDLGRDQQRRSPGWGTGVVVSIWRSRQYSAHCIPIYDADGADKPYGTCV